MLSDLKNHRAFTLVELLVVIAIIGVLVAILLPAVQSARESTRGLQCKNNLKQIGVALDAYRSTNRCFPPGYVYDGRDDPVWAWGAFLLPHIEQKPLYENLAVGNNALDSVVEGVALYPSSRPATLELLDQELAVFRCPSGASKRLCTGRALKYRESPQPVKAPASNYFACAGTRIDAGDVDKLGVMYGNSRITRAHIKDGMSNTFAAGERDARSQDGTWCGVGRPEKGNNHEDGPPMALGITYYDLNDRTPVGKSGFTSQHPGGANFLMCDGSVHFVNEAIDSRRIGNGTEDLNTWVAQAKKGNVGVYQLLGMRADGQPASLYNNGR